MLRVCDKNVSDENYFAAHENYCFLFPRELYYGLRQFIWIVKSDTRVLIFFSLIGTNFCFLNIFFNYSDFFSHSNHLSYNTFIVTLQTYSFTKAQFKNWGVSTQFFTLPHSCESINLLEACTLVLSDFSPNNVFH